MVDVYHAAGGVLVRKGRANLGTPEPGPSVVFGTNAGDDDAKGNKSLATALSWFGRVPLTRWYYGVNGLPSTFDPTRHGGSPERRTQVSFKRQPTQITDGSYDATLTGYLTSIPSNWQVLFTYWHEPNAELRDGAFTAAQYKAAQTYISNLMVSLGVTANGRVILAPNYTSPYVGGTNNAYDRNWVNTPDTLHPGARLTWDVYGNLYGGTGYNSPYRSVAAMTDQVFAEIQALGYWDNWGITEFNTPPRNFDSPPWDNPLGLSTTYVGTPGGTEDQRVVWLEEFVEYCLGSPAAKAAYPNHKPPKSFILWEGYGVQFLQSFLTSTTRDWWRSYMEGSA